MDAYKHKKLYIKGIIGTLILALMFGVAIQQPAMAAQKLADTVSTAGIDFTPIPTAADSIAAAKKKAAEVTKAHKATEVNTPGSVVTASSDKSKTLWQTFLTGLLSGFLALMMPCLYPLLPLTVSFFTKLGGSRSKAIWYSLIYGLSIIVVYVSLGLVLTIFFGPDTMNRIATSGIFNLIIFALLVVFAISFLGAFEITLPSSLVNKIDAKSDQGGLIGIFFMALTLVVVSFSCTGGVVAGDLSDAFSKGERLAPAISMLGFSSAIALPFTVFAMFPSLLKSLPKSGGWLNSVKVVLGFLELALALKFLSNVDLAYHWNWLDREVFLALWIGIGILICLYLWGKIQFPHDSKTEHLSVMRVMISLVTLSFVIYMIPGMWGAPLKAISAYLPPPATQDFDLTNLQLGSGNVTSTNSNVIQSKKYDEIFKRGRIKGLDLWYDYDQALQLSKSLKKPILIDFTGWNCVNCRKMENDVWSSQEVHKRLANDFIMLELYVDDKTQLASSEQYRSTFSGKNITTIGAKNSDYEASKYNVNSQPYYVIINGDAEVLVPPQGANYDVDNYIKFLDSGITAYKLSDSKK